jgi:hypothetical protein
MSGEMADRGQDPRGAPDLDPLWTILDLTPAGRGATWYPSLNTPARQRSSKLGNQAADHLIVSWQSLLNAASHLRNSFASTSYGRPRTRMHSLVLEVAALLNAWSVKLLSIRQKLVNG